MVFVAGGVLVIVTMSLTLGLLQLFSFAQSREAERSAGATGFLLLVAGFLLQIVGTIVQAL
jgi:hypothetical protein